MEEKVKAMAKEVIILALSDISYNIKEGEKLLQEVELKINNILSIKKRGKVGDKELAYLRHQRDETAEKIKNYYNALTWFNSPSRKQNSYYYWLGYSLMNGQAIKDYVCKIQKGELNGLKIRNNRSCLSRRIAR